MRISSKMDNSKSGLLAGATIFFSEVGGYNPFQNLRYAVLRVLFASFNAKKYQPQQNMGGTKPPNLEVGGYMYLPQSMPVLARDYSDKRGAFCKCKACNKTFSVASMGRSALVSHMNPKNSTHANGLAHLRSKSD